VVVEERKGPLGLGREVGRRDPCGGKEGKGRAGPMGEGAVGLGWLLFSFSFLFLSYT
jgi:hypothetical protein